MSALKQPPKSARIAKDPKLAPKKPPGDCLARLSHIFSPIVSSTPSKLYKSGDILPGHCLEPYDFSAQDKLERSIRKGKMKTDLISRLRRVDEVDEKRKVEKVNVPAQQPKDVLRKVSKPSIGQSEQVKTPARTETATSKIDPVISKKPTTPKSEISVGSFFTAPPISPNVAPSSDVEVPLACFDVPQTKKPKKEENAKNVKKTGDSKRESREQAKKGEHFDETEVPLASLYVPEPTKKRELTKSEAYKLLLLKCPPGPDPLTLLWG